MSAPFVELDGLERTFAIRRGPFRSVPLRAVQDVNLCLERGESLGLVGESGCGKSTLARIVAGLLDPTGGRILVGGRDLTDASGAERRLWRQNVQIVFQDPHASLNPRRTIFATVAEPLVIHRSLSSEALRARVADLLDTVGLPGRFMYRYPHELSGGQKQRVCIARAVALEPALLVLDEPTSALDVSVQAQILEFLKDLRTRFGLAYLFISHDLSVVRIMCDRVAIMYLGRIVEEGPTAEVFERPRHPYTRALLDAVPLPVADRPAPRLLTGDVPSPIALPAGCAFHRRCPKAVPGHCDTERPHLSPGPDPSHTVACHYPLDQATPARKVPA